MKFLIGIQNQTKRLWYSIIYILVNITVVFGFLCPFLISFNDDFVAILGVATAQAKANQLLNASLTPTLVNYKAIEKWDGKLPTYSGGGAVPFLNINK